MTPPRHGALTGSYPSGAIRLNPAWTLETIKHHLKPNPVNDQLNLGREF